MNKKRHMSKIFIYFFLVLGGIVVFFPFYWMVITSLKTEDSLFSVHPTFLPNPVAWSNYVHVWITSHFLRYTINSLGLGILDLGGTLLSCSFVAFGFAFFKFKGRDLLFMAMLATLMLPRQVTIIPQFLIWNHLGAVDTYYPLIIPRFLGEAFGIFLMHQFFRSLPRELFMSATVDGANPFQIFYKIYLPISKPALSALSIFAFINIWNNTLEPLVYLTSSKLFTLPLGLLFLHSSLEEKNFAFVLAGAVCTALPPIIVFVLARKHFIRGIASSGLKG